jgi:hypothetical protein
MAPSSLDDGIIEALAGYLAGQATADPPVGCLLQTVRGGNLQEDPAAKPGGFLTLHIGDPDDPTVCHEVVGSSRARFENDGRATLFGRSREMGGGADWVYRYTIKVDYYFTKTGETRTKARAKATALNQWLVRQIEGLRADQLGVYRIGIETLAELHVSNLFQDEGGGPPASFIWLSKVRVEALVHVG